MDPIRAGELTINIIWGAAGGAVSVDASVATPTGEAFTATFCTVKQIQEAMDRNRVSGENRGGEYFWGSDVIVVREPITQEKIVSTLSDLWQEGYLSSALARDFSPRTNDGRPEREVD